MIFIQWHPLIVNIFRFKSPWVVLSVVFVIFQWLTVIFFHAIITQKSFKWFFNDKQNTFVCVFNTSYKMSHNKSLFYFVRECEIYNSFRFALRITLNLKLVIIWKNSIKSINEISIYCMGWFDKRVDCKPKV